MDFDSLSARSIKPASSLQRETLSESLKHPIQSTQFIDRHQVPLFSFSLSLIVVLFYLTNSLSLFSQTVRSLTHSIHSLLTGQTEEREVYVLYTLPHTLELAA